jgi:hypothetical protein
MLSQSKATSLGNSSPVRALGKQGTAAHRQQTLGKQQQQQQQIALQQQPRVV